MTLTIEEIYNHILGIRDNLILDIQHPSKEDLDEARQKAVLKLERLAFDVNELIKEKKC